MPEAGLPHHQITQSQNHSSSMIRITDEAKEMFTSTQIAPKSIKLDAGNGNLGVQWADGHLSAFPYQYLRDRCPCATCAGKAPAPHVPSSPFPMFGVSKLKPVRAELVGRYALQVFWSDGHSSGIYAFDHLRELCPCADCAAQQREIESQTEK